MSRSNKNKIVVTLLSALAFGASDASAMNSGVKDAKLAQNIGVASEQSKKITGANFWKLASSTVGLLAVFETIHSIVGRTTDSKFGNYSIGRAIRNRVKKNEQPGVPNEQDVEDSKKKNKFSDLKDTKKFIFDEEMEKNNGKASHECDENLNAVLGKFKEAAKNVPGLFSNYENLIKDAYQKILNNNYKVFNQSNDKVLGAILNFMTNQKKVETGAEVIEITNNLTTGFKFKISFKGKEDLAFLINGNVIFNSNTILKF